jgi:Tat protein translocase TatB subunit
MQFEVVQMLGFGMSEILLILIVALLVVGPKKLPELAKTIGKGYAQFRRSMNDLKSAVNIEEEFGTKQNSTLRDSYKQHWENRKREEAENNTENKADVKQEPTAETVKNEQPAEQDKNG